MTNLTFGVDEKKLSKADRAFLVALRKSAIFAESGQMRVYPNGALAAQVLGFSAVEEYKLDGRPVSQITGRDGIELVAESDVERRRRLARDGNRQPATASWWRCATRTCGRATA